MTFNLGPYVVGEMIGSGGTSTVYRGYNSKKRQEVAVKLLTSGPMVDAEWMKRIHREISTVVQLDHPNIVPIIDSGQQDDLVYIVMPYYKRDSLETHLADKRLSPAEGAKLFEQIASALDYVHEKGIVHRDIKPGNILFDDEGNALLADFGLVQVPDASVSLTGSGIVGTPKYISPEQARGAVIDGRADQYSMGVILFELLTGEVPFSAETPIGVLMKHITDPMPALSELRPNLAGPLEIVIQKATAKTPEHRFASVGEFNTAFQGALKHAIDPQANPAPEIDVSEDLSGTFYFSSLEQQQAMQATAPPAPRWPRWAMLAAAVAILALACPLAIAAGSTLFGSGGDRLPVGIGAAEATELGGTLSALYTEVSAGGSNGELSEGDVEQFAVETLSAQGGVDADVLAQLDPASTFATITSTPIAGTPSNTDEATAATANSANPTNTAASSGSGGSSPSNTPVPTSGGGSNPTNTPAPSATPTNTSIPPTATQTTTPVPSATNTTPPTATSVPTATEDVCSLLSLQSFSINNKQVSWSLVNNSGQAVTVDNLSFNWPASNGNLKDIRLGATVIWTQDTAPPSVSFGGIGQSLSAAQQKAFVYKFVNSAQSSGYSLTVNTLNGCQIIASE